MEDQILELKCVNVGGGAAIPTYPDHTFGSAAPFRLFSSLFQPPGPLQEGNDDNDRVSHVFGLSFLP